MGAAPQVQPGVSELEIMSELPEPTPHPTDEAEDQERQGHTAVTCPCLVTAV